jgi:cyclohexanecarboxylate-CoA ligase
VPDDRPGLAPDTDDQLAYTDGRPVSAARSSIVREDGTEAAGPGEEGEVRLRGPMLFKGYTDPALNEAEAFDEDGRFRTGDLGHVRPDGHVTLTGRVKDIIIRKGENISAKEVEDVLYAHPKVGDVAVIGLPDRERGERVCAVVETAAGRRSRSPSRDGGGCKAAGPHDARRSPSSSRSWTRCPRNATLKILKPARRAGRAGLAPGVAAGLHPRPRRRAR